ncbi:L-type lectin-domain containing receptor kinase IX.1-like [Cryptomeria japonica]|uniref:L-type lectin-domain containing receptor kinase IX.1-like n=1 Tax=Cryptomeria japonica TaxID=3369 RepID=UPI0027DA1D2A|nr:L-type lectin-domain containing receptor kinase IX.1-like [Cryptomeria japonica]
MANPGLGLTSIILFIMILISVIIFIIDILLQWKWYVSTRKHCQENPDRRIEKGVHSPDRWIEKSVHSVREFLYDELVAATGNFSNVIGEGGSGKVYKGTLSNTDKMVAVKRIKSNSDQGKKEFESEVIINSNILHRNLVKFLGWCHQKDDFYLVYEYLCGNSLDKYILGKPRSVLCWVNRYRIACNIASVLHYLHENCPETILHRDIKAANVMLDSDLTAKLGDFGLARKLKPGKEEHTTCQAGSFGYMAPEILQTGKATRESDVYSFGALALAIACGKQPADMSTDNPGCSLVKSVWQCKRGGRIVDAADEKLKGIFIVEEMERLMSVGLLCCHPEPTERPTIEKVMAMLKTNEKLPPIPDDLYGKPLQLELGSSSVGSSDGSISWLSSTSSHSNVTQ